MPTSEMRTRSDGRLLDALHDLRDIEPQRVITVRMPAVCHQLLGDAAHAARRSMNDHCLALLFAPHEDQLAEILKQLNQAPAVRVTVPEMPCGAGVSP